MFNYFRKKTSPNGIVLAQETHSTRKCEVPSAHQWGRTNSIRFSHGTSAGKGVFIAFHEKLDYVILDEYSHDNGNFLILHVRIQGLLVILVNYHAPNAEKEHVKVLTQIKEFLSKIEYDQNTTMIWGHDFNVIFDNSLDVDGGNPTLRIQFLTKIHTPMAENELCDMFRLRHPGEPRLTWRRKNPFKQRRLEYFLISDSLQDSVSSISTSPSAQSDHSTTVLKISPVKEHIKGASYWKFNNSLLNDKDFVSEMKIKIPEFYQEATELSNPNARWDYVKYQIRQFSLKISKEKAKQRKLNELVLKVELKNLKVQYP